MRPNGETCPPLPATICRPLTQETETQREPAHPDRPASHPTCTEGSVVNADRAIWNQVNHLSPCASARWVLRYPVHPHCDHTQLCSSLEGQSYTPENTKTYNRIGRGLAVVEARRRNADGRRMGRYPRHKQRIRLNNPASRKVEEKTRRH